MSGDSVSVYEVSLRDGLQNEKGVVPVVDKKRLFDARRRLKERIETMLRDELRPLRPSNDPHFSLTIQTHHYDEKLFPM